jgi:hypothetical protein
MNHVDKPYPRSYWVQPGSLLAGLTPSSQNARERETKLKALLRCGIRTFINLMEPDELDHEGNLFRPYEPELKRLAEKRGIGISCLSFPIRDLGTPSLESMRRILDSINASLDRGDPVYVHCWGGKGRTGTVVGCWLLEQGLATAENVLGLIRELRKGLPDSGALSPETQEQQLYVLLWPQAAAELKRE